MLIYFFYKAVWESLIRYKYDSSVRKPISSASETNCLCLFVLLEKWLVLKSTFPIGESVNRPLCKKPIKQSVIHHILHSEFQLLPSGRRFRVPPRRLNTFKNSFISVSIKLVDEFRQTSALIIPRLAQVSTLDFYYCLYIYWFFFFTLLLFLHTGAMLRLYS